jgi:hypothetical protein
MKSQKPAEGIMLNRMWGTARSYTIACDCGDRDHATQMWIELGDEHDAELQNVTVTFYVETASPWYSMSRWRQIWQLLTQGSVRQEHALILSRQSALNMAQAINASVAEMQQINVVPIDTDQDL